ncbi:MAG: Ig-like domain-containing protein [Candidatus Magasanikbacteria bacterium]|nr:Ig-like domain-containing protein [Candidatus Magasanikbacteria bacterium]
MLQWSFPHNGDSYGTKTTARLWLVLAVFFCFLLVPFRPVAAQSIAAPDSSLNKGVAVIQQPLGLPATDIRLIIANIIRVALGLIGLVLLVLFLYGGYLYMTSGGNEEQVASAKKILINATIGLGIILSAYAIVVFAMRLLGLSGLIGPGGGGGLTAPGEENFRGSGALGAIIKDHYPGRNQKDVPRNTKIVITFRRPINPDSFIVNSNQSKDSSGNPIYGDCLNQGAGMNWETDCDQIKSGASYIVVTRADTNEVIRGAAVLASYENGKLSTVVIRPYDTLGSAIDKVAYRVHIGGGITINDSANGNPSIFAGRSAGRDFYEWNFTTDTTLDNTPPRVSSVFPAAKTTEAKNSAIQIDFSEAMDPIGLQGAFTSTVSGYYALRGNEIFLKSGKSGLPAGTFHLTNGYRTLEFTPSKECGENACGGKVYCLPVCDLAGANCRQDDYEILVKAAQTFSANSFESAPFSGAMDLAGNALDGNGDGKVQVAGTAASVFPGQETPDNYFWGFILNDTVDVTAPYIQRVFPGVDADYVSANADFGLVFSKRMLADPMYTIGVEEQPAPKESLCRVPRMFFDLANGTTLTRLEHCPFVDTERRYYFPTVDSRVEDVHFNCFYPGKGPLGNDPTTKESLVCDSQHLSQCCAVNAAAAPFCCNGAANLTDQKACLANLRANSP